MRKVVLAKTRPPGPVLAAKVVKIWQPKLVPPGPVLAAKSVPTLPKVVLGVDRWIS